MIHSPFRWAGVMLATLALLAALACTTPAAESPDGAGQPSGTRQATSQAGIVPTPTILRGSGQQATQPIKLPSTMSVVSVGHTGARNFIVKTFIAGKETLLINTVGGYQGQRPLFTDQPVTFDIQADGAWILTVDVVPRVPSGVFEGRSDMISGLFDPPRSGPWDITHNGQRNFIVQLHCASGTSIVQNAIGPVSGSGVVTFGRGPCVWEVQADGAWSLKPRP